MNAGDIFRKAFSYADAFWIKGVGRPVRHVRSNTTFRGFYQLPTIGNSVFGIDASDEMAIECDRDLVMSLKLKKDDVLDVAGTQWRLVHTETKDNAYTGVVRTNLICCRHHISEAAVCCEKEPVNE